MALFAIVGFGLGVLASYMDHRLGRCSHTMWTCHGSWAVIIALTVFFGLIGALIS